ncbi:glycosyltransferase family A protein [Actinomycetaceae bacterium MB13-C1-2]|nr:glycosyltransferase family A protein [Actinomycetaceae bacterium MB13-C1-2]
MSAYSVVITAHNQRGFVREAAESVLGQSLAPAKVLVVDDGSTDEKSIEVLAELDKFPCVEVVRQPNGGVSSARNLGISLVGTEYVAVLDGDDRWKPTFAESSVELLDGDDRLVGVSSWMRMFGVATALVQPGGGTLVDFLSRNQSPSSIMMRKSAWLASGGYDAAMRDGFEDWDFCLSLLADGGAIEIVPEALIDYRTSSVSANITSMNGRSELFGRLIDKHSDDYRANYRQVLLDLDDGRQLHLRNWEELASQGQKTATFGDGGMASVVRIESRNS